MRPSFLLSLLLCILSPTLTQAQPGQEMVADSSLAAQYLATAEKFRKAGKYQSAAENYQRSISYFEKIDDWDGLVKSKSEEGYCLVRLGKRELGKKQIDEAYQLAMEKLGRDHMETAGAIYNLSRYYLIVDSLDRSLSLMNEAFQLMQNQEDITTNDLALCQAQIAMVYFKKYDYEKATSHFEAGILIAQKDLEKNRTLMANLLNMIGILAGRIGDYQKALETYQQGLDFLDKEAPGYLLSASILHGNISHASLKIGDTQTAYLNAQKNYAHILELFGEGHPKLGAPYQALGDVYVRMERFPEALQMYEKALDLIEETNPNTIFNRLAVIHTNLGMTYKNQGELELAVKHYLTAMDFKEKAYGKNAPEMVVTLTDLGDSYYQLNRFEEALSTLEKVLAISIQHYGKIHHKTAKIQKVLGEIYLGQNQLQHALEEADLSISGFLQLGDSSQTANAIPHLDVFFAIALKAKILQRMASDAPDGRAHLEEALAACEHGLSLLDEKYGAYEGQTSNITNISFAKPTLDEGIYTSWLLYQETGEPAYREKAFLFCEKSKALTLKESFNQYSANQLTGIPKEARRKLDQLQKNLTYYSEMLIAEEAKKEEADLQKVKLFIQKKYAYSQRYDSLRSVLKQTYPIYEQLQRNNQTVSVEALQNTLSPDELLIEYYLSDQQLFTFLIQKDHFELLAQAVEPEWSDQIRLLHQICKTPPKDDQWKADLQTFIDLSRSLYQSLFPSDHPLHQAGTSARLIIIPDGILHLIPFNVLLTQAPNTDTPEHLDYRQLPYLIKEFDLRYSYSSTLMAETLQRKEKRFWKKILPADLHYVGFAPSYSDGAAIRSRSPSDSLKLASIYRGVFRGELKKLTYNIPEVESVASLLGGQSFKQEEASEQTFKQVVEQADILHLAMHAFTNDEDPMFSQLAFEPKERDSVEDGRLHAYELYHMRLKANLAVLSACNTGAGKIVQGEGVLSLGRAFQYAGVPNVIMSLWTANDQSTKSVVTDVFTKLKAGMQKDKALAEAQRQFLRMDASQETTHPYFWANLVLVGDGEALWPRGWFSSPWLLGGVFVLLLFLGFGLRRKSGNNT